MCAQDEWWYVSYMGFYPDNFACLVSGFPLVQFGSAASNFFLKLVDPPFALPSTDCECLCVIEIIIH